MNEEWQVPGDEIDDDTFIITKENCHRDFRATHNIAASIEYELKILEIHPIIDNWTVLRLYSKLKKI